MSDLKSYVEQLEKILQVTAAPSGSANIWNPKICQPESGDPNFKFKNELIAHAFEILEADQIEYANRKSMACRCQAESIQRWQFGFLRSPGA